MAPSHSVGAPVFAVPPAGYGGGAPHARGVQGVRKKHCVSARAQAVGGYRV